MRWRASPGGASHADQSLTQHRDHSGADRQHRRLGAGRAARWRRGDRRRQAERHRPARSAARSQRHSAAVRLPCGRRAATRCSRCRARCRAATRCPRRCRKRTPPTTSSSPSPTPSRISPTSSGARSTRRSRTSRPDRRSTPISAPSCRSSVELKPMPGTLAAQVPQTRDYQFAVADNRVLLVSPADPDRGRRLPRRQGPRDHRRPSLAAAVISRLPKLVPIELTA